MRILYGVQGTGNGHITRARMMAEAFNDKPVQVDYIFSGKDGEYFNMEPFGDYRVYSGLSFIAEEGKIKYLKTLRRNNLFKFYQDVKSLNVKDYDLVITDFEPISAWSAYLHKIPSIGISHQSAFRFKVPVAGSNPIANVVMKYFAPANEYLGLHWHHFDNTILPPMIKTDLELKATIKNKILVYLPFLPVDQYHALFSEFPEYRFVQYHPVQSADEFKNISINPLSRNGFLEDFRDCSGLVCSAGFGACSEAIHYGKKLMVVPLQGQMEQLSNAAALQQLGFGAVMKILNQQGVSDWLSSAQPKRRIFPDVAEEIVNWIINNNEKSLQQLTTETWAKVVSE